MTKPAPTQEAPAPLELPTTYRLLAVFSGIPLPTIPALHQAGFCPEDTCELTDEHRDLLRPLVRDELIVWARRGPDGPGYTLTGRGEAAIEVYFERYGALKPQVRRFPRACETAKRNEAQDRQLYRLLTVFNRMAEGELVPVSFEQALESAEIPDDKDGRTLLTTLISDGYLRAVGTGVAVLTRRHGRRRLDQWRRLFGSPRRPQ